MPETEKTKRLQTDTLMRKLAPDLSDEMARRAMILERIAVMQPVGRRQLAQCLRLPERVTAPFPKEEERESAEAAAGAGL